MAVVSINKKLNIAIPVEENGVIKAWIHSVPISREVFESNYLLLVKTLSNLYSQGINPVMAVRIARLGLKDTAKEMNDTVDISEGFMNEVHRLTNVLIPDKGKWTTIPYTQIRSRQILDEDVLTEVENAIVYFTVASAVHLKSELSMAYQGLLQIWNAVTTPLNVTEYGNSLPTPTSTENTGEKPATKTLDPKALSIPS